MVKVKTLCFFIDAYGNFHPGNLIRATKNSNSPEVILGFLNYGGIQAVRLNLKKFSQKNIFFDFWLRNLRVATPNLSEC